MTFGTNAIKMFAKNSKMMSLRIECANSIRGMFSILDKADKGIELTEDENKALMQWQRQLHQGAKDHIAFGNNLTEKEKWTQAGKMLIKITSAMSEAKIFFLPEEDIEEMFTHCSNPEEVHLPFDTTAIEFQPNEKREGLYGLLLTEDIEADERKISAYFLFANRNENFYIFFKPTNDALKDMENDVSSTGVKIKPWVEFALNLISVINARNCVKQGESVRFEGRPPEKSEAGSEFAPEPFYVCTIRDPAPYYESADKFNKAVKRPYRFQFDVRGHYRHLEAQKWTHKRGETVWVTAHKRGEGIYIPHRYAFIRQPPTP